VSLCRAAPFVLEPDLPYVDPDYMGEDWDAEMMETEFSKVESDVEKMREMERIRAS
jgi:hypothetical protein